MTMAKTLTRLAREAFRTWWALAVWGYASAVFIVPMIALVPRFETSWPQAVTMVLIVETVLLALLAAALAFFVLFDALVEWDARRTRDALNRQTAEHYQKTAKDALQ